jgi:hypothetical protein
MTDRLRLKAVDADDLKVVSAFLQDAIVAMADVGYLTQEQSFVLVANRFRWETADTPRGPSAEDDAGMAPDVEDAPFERIHCAVRFAGVTAVRYRGIDRQNRTLPLELLALEHAAGAVLLHFAGGGCIRVETPALSCMIEDLGEPWPTGRRPAHEAGAEPTRASATGS